MCKCTPTIEAPFCGIGECVWPSKAGNVYETLFPNLRRELPGVFITHIEFVPGKKAFVKFKHRKKAYVKSCRIPFLYNEAHLIEDIRKIIY